MSIARREQSPRTRALATLVTHPSADRLHAIDVELLDAADAHGVMPLLGEALRTAGLRDSLAAGVRDRLDRARREALAIDAISTRHAGRTLAALAAAGIEAIVFKGAALAQTHYAASWLRPRGDVDLLVRASQAVQAGVVLEQLGCRKAPRPEGTLVTYQSRYVGRAASMEVAYDLHWRVVDPQVFDRVLDHAAVSAAARPGASAGERLAAPVHAMLIACVHRSAHHEDTDRLLLLCDIDRLARRFSSDEWSQFTSEAERGAVRAVCLRGLDLAASLLETPVPPAVRSALAGAGEAEPTARFAAGPMRRLDILRSDLAMLGWAQRVSLLREHVLPAPAYVASRYGTERSLLLPLLYAHRLVGGLATWLRRPE